MVLNTRGYKVGDKIVYSAHPGYKEERGVVTRNSAPGEDVYAKYEGFTYEQHSASKFVRLLERKNTDNKPSWL